MKKLLAVTIMAFGLSGCFTTQHRMDVYDLKYMKVDCANKEAQIRFLETQMSTPWERTLAGNNAYSLLGSLSTMMGGSYEQHKAVADRQYDAIAKRLIWEIRSSCP